MFGTKVPLAVAGFMVAALGAVVIAAPSVGAGASTPGTTKQNLVVGKELYREYCGECHALSAALAAGFGSNNGLGQFGGPSFNNLRVPFNLSVVAVTEGFAGHEVVVTKVNWAELHEVAAYLAAATKHNAYLARVSDG